MKTLYHCSESSGLGAFVSSVVGAYAVSLLSSSKFVLGSNCTTEASRMNREVTQRFYIPMHSVPKSIRIIRLNNFPNKNEIAHDLIQDNRVGRRAFCLINSEHTGLDKLFRGTYGIQNKKRLNHSSYNTSFDTIVNRVFQPSQRILTLYKKWMRDKNLSSYNILHVRLGDGNMACERKKWEWKNHQIKTLFRNNPVNHLMSAKVNASVVLSDTAWVRDLAKFLGFVTMDTGAIHMGMIDNHNTSNIDGLFLEWYIMRRAKMCFTFSQTSMFSRSACMGRMHIVRL